MFALGKKTVNQIKYEIGCKHIVHGQGGGSSCFAPLNGIIEVQISSYLLLHCFKIR